MEVEIIKQKEDKIKVTIACNQVDERIFRLKRHIEAFHERIQGRKEGQVVFVELSEILYFEVVDNRSFLYTSDDVLEIEQKLYESYHSGNHVQRGAALYFTEICRRN